MTLIIVKGLLVADGLIKMVIEMVTEEIIEEVTEVVLITEEVIKEVTEVLLSLNQDLPTNQEMVEEDVDPEMVVAEEDTILVTEMGVDMVMMTEMMVMAETEDRAPGELPLLTGIPLLPICHE